VFYDQQIVESPWKFTQSDNGYSAEEVSLYTSVFLELWALESFPQNKEKCVSAFNKIELNWQAEIFTYANPSDGTTRLLGLTYMDLKPGKILVFVATRPYGTPIAIDQSAYGHELIHIALFAITGNAQASHFQEKGSHNWPQDYEKFLIKVSKEYRKKINENKRADRAITKS
jgi:hypothetical protein